MNDVTLYETRDGIAHFVFNRPQARNALTFEMYEHLREACEQADAESSIKALLIYGAGDKAFASGTDIAEFRALQSAQDAVDYEIKIERVLSTLEKCRVPTIAAIAGACTGGGAAIAACCDLRLAAANARFGFPIARTLGNCLSVANYGASRRHHRRGAGQGSDFHRAPDRRRRGQDFRPRRRNRRARGVFRAR